MQYHIVYVFELYIIIYILLFSICVSFQFVYKYSNKIKYTKNVFFLHYRCKIRLYMYKFLHIIYDYSILNQPIFGDFMARLFFCPVILIFND